MINEHKTGEWKIQLCMHVNFISFKDKLVLFMYGVMTHKLGQVMKQVILLKNVLNFF